MRSLKKMPSIYMKHSMFLVIVFVLLVSCPVLTNTVLAETSDSDGIDNIVFASGTITSNVNQNDYQYNSAQKVNSYLTEITAGQLMRVEGKDNGDVLVEYLDLSGKVHSAKTIPGELSFFGGFFAGEDAYYIVYCQDNSEESDSVEVIRIVKYTKAWDRSDACSVSGINTKQPLRSGSLRMTEAMGFLFIHTSHLMYKSSDGLNHQANMTFQIRESDMSMFSSNTGISNYSTGYASHSFNQFINTDGNTIYRVDHGDAYPRSVVLSAVSANARVSHPSNTYSLFDIEGETGDNYTGVSVGGYEISASNHLIAFSQANTFGNSVRSIKIAAFNEQSRQTVIHTINEYGDDDGLFVRAPQLVKVNPNKFVLMWMESNADPQYYYYPSHINESDVLCITVLDASGNQSGPVYKFNSMKLSDCQPILLSDQTIAWYVTDGKRMMLYRIDPDKIDSIRSKYQVTFDNNGHGIAPETQIIYEDDTVTEPKNMSEHLYEFGGWYTDQDYLDQYDFSAPVKKDIHLYAKWQHVCYINGHKWDQGTVVKKPTCTEWGDTEYKCQVCGETMLWNYDIWPVGHDYREAGMKNGMLLYKCTVCGDETTEPYYNEVIFEDLSDYDFIDTTPEDRDGIGNNVLVNGSRYSITGSGTAVLTAAANKKKVTVPASIIAGNTRYKVTEINQGAFTNPGIRTVVIGKNVRRIRKNAFANSKVTKLIVKTKKLTKKNVKGSLKASKIKRMQIKVGSKKTNRKYIKKYKKFFTKKNAGRKITIK